MRTTVIGVDPALPPSDDGGREVFVYLPDELYAGVLEQALHQGLTIADVVRAAAAGYLALVALAGEGPR